MNQNRKVAFIGRAENIEYKRDPQTMLYSIKAVGGDSLVVDDGFHTIDELYDHRITLYITLCRFIEKDTMAPHGYVWRSKRHSDGELCFGTGTQFVLGIGSKQGEQITYHIPVERWEETNFAKELDKAHEYDGHTSQDVVDRLKKLWSI